MKMEQVNGSQVMEKTPRGSLVTFLSPQRLRLSNELLKPFGMSIHGLVEHSDCLYTMRFLEKLQTVRLIDA
mgnify:CR=1 FL=1